MVLLGQVVVQDAVGNTLKQETACKCGAETGGNVGFFFFRLRVHVCFSFAINILITTVSQSLNPQTKRGYPYQDVKLDVGIDVLRAKGWVRVRFIMNK